MTVLVVLLAVAVGLLGILVFGLLRTHAEILRALDRAGISLDGASSPPSGAAAARTEHERGAEAEAARDIVGTVPQAGPTKVAVTGVGHLTLLAFLSSGCRTCSRFWEEFARPDLELPGSDTRLVIVGQDPAHDSESALATLAPDGVKAVLSSVAWEDYDVPGAPYFALVDGVEGRVVGAGSALEWGQLRELLEQALSDAGLDDRPGASRHRQAPRSPRGRHRRVDDALLSAGIGPGHPSLYPPGSDSNGGRGGSGPNGGRGGAGTTGKLGDASPNGGRGGAGTTGKLGDASANGGRGGSGANGDGQGDSAEAAADR